MKAMKQFFSGIYNLILGLLTTGKHLGRHAITLQYPKERWPMPERSRGVVVLLSDKESGKLNCTACMLCMKACPVAAIFIEREKNAETKKWEAIKFVIDNTICCFCGLCEETCAFDAIKLANKYEFSTFDQSALVYDKNHLAELGRDVAYTPTVKKKPAAATAKPAGDKPAVKEAPKPETAKTDAPAKTEEKTGQKPAETKPKKPAALKEVKNKEDKPIETPAPDKAAEKQAELELDKNEDKKELGN
jgi:NADH-quinone oxidoreductase subunit I